MPRSPFIIAELSGNHNQDFTLAKAMIKAAASTGVDAIKLQTYTADSMTLNVRNDEFMVSAEGSLWEGDNLYDLYAKAATPYEWHKPLFEYANSLGLVAFSSPFDIDAVHFLESLDVPLYKIASFELTDLPLIEAVAKTGKSMIMSTGMAIKEEIAEAVSLVRSIGSNDITLLKCTSTYPAKIEDSNLATLSDLANHFKCHVGLSDHTQGISAAIAATALGASVIEKHFVLDRQAGGVDAAFSMEPHELTQLVTGCRQAHASLGEITYGGTHAEQDYRKYRRSIYISKDSKAGDILSESNMKIIRPSLGLAPKNWQDVLGRKLNCDAQKGEALNWSMLMDSDAE